MFSLSTMKTPSDSFFVNPGFNSDASTVPAVGRRPGSGFGGLTTFPCGSNVSSRTASAWIGTATAFSRSAVVMSAVQVNPGRTSGIWPSIVTTTLKLVAWRTPPAVAALIGLLPISVTFAVKDWSGSASIVTFVFWPSLTLGMSVSSTSISASMTDMSATMSSTTLGLLVNPAIAVSPSSTFRFVMIPSIGDSIVTRLRSCSPTRRRPSGS